MRGPVQTYNECARIERLRQDFMTEAVNNAELRRMSTGCSCAVLIADRSVFATTASGTTEPCPRDFRIVRKQITLRTAPQIRRKDGIGGSRPYHLWAVDVRPAG